jgi:hypothetical protein
MTKHFTLLLAAAAIAACSSNPGSVEEPAAATYPLVQDFPMPEPIPEPFEDALAPADPFASEAPPALRAPEHVLPPRADTRPALADACDVIVKRTRNGVVLTAVTDLDRSGDYSFIITKSGGGNSSDIQQGGPFTSSRGRSIELSSSEISVERGSSWRATLRLTSHGRELCRRTVRS